MAAAQEEDHAIIEGENNLVILAPIYSGEIIYSPACNRNRRIKKEGRYSGEVVIERFVQHLVKKHKKNDNTSPFFTESYRSRECLYVPLEGGTNTQNGVIDHFSRAHSELVPLLALTRRNSIRMQILPEPEGTCRASAPVTSGSPQPSTSRQGSSEDSNQPLRRCTRSRMASTVDATLIPPTRSAAPPSGSLFQQCTGSNTNDQHNDEPITPSCSRGSSCDDEVFLSPTGSVFPAVGDEADELSWTLGLPPGVPPVHQDDGSASLATTSCASVVATGSRGP